MTKRKKGIIGHDPLAWISVDDEDEGTEESKSPTTDSTQQTVPSSEPHPFGINVDAFLLGFDLIEGKATAIVTDFYNTLFLNYPQVKPLFENTDIEDQQQKLAGAISLLANNINDVDKLFTALSDLGERHQQYGATAEHFSAVTSTLLTTIKKHIGRKWTKKIAASWEVVLTKGAEIMLSAYEEESKLSEPVKSVEVINAPNQEAEPSSNEEGVLHLVSSQDISTVGELLDNIKSCIGKGQVNINISKVTRIDTSCLQILYLLVRDADINGYDAKITGVSEAFERSVHLMGMGGVLKVVA